MLQRKKICFVAPFIYPLFTRKAFEGSGGAERQFFLFGLGLKKNEWDVSFIVSKPKGHIEEKTVLPVHFATFSYLGGPKWKILTSCLSLWYAMSKAKADYYILKVPGHLLALMSIFCKTHKRRLVFWAQMTHDANPCERIGMNKAVFLLQDWGLKRSDIIIAQTEDQKKAFINNFNINAKVVRSICDTLKPFSCPEVNTHSAKKEIDILWAANSHHKKRQEVFFELAKLLPHRTFAIAINKGNESRFEKAREDAKQLTNVVFLGNVQPTEMEAWFVKTKLFLNTSIREGFPNTFLQAWMNGVPVVSLNIDPDGIIHNKKLGCVIASQYSVLSNKYDYRKLASNIVEPVERLLNNEDLRIQIGKRAVEYVSKNHAPNVVVPKLIKALQ